MKKLKNQYRHTTLQQVRGKNWQIYYRVRSGIHKHFSTKQEKSFYFLHRIECKSYPVKLRAARGAALANPWDDYPSSVCSLAKSWKHSSKRRKQHYR